MNPFKNYIAGFVFLLGIMPFVSLAQEQRVSIRIGQDDPVTLTEFYSVLRLEKKAFKFQVLLQNVEGVYVFASIRDSVYRYTETGPIRDFIYLPLLKLNEDEFNRFKSLNISETGWSYWHYSPSSESHPFSKKVYPLDSVSFVCTKLVKEFYDVADNFTIKIRDIDKPLYLFFIAVADYDDTGRPLKELMRRKVKIEWTDDDE